MDLLKSLLVSYIILIYISVSSQGYLINNHCTCLFSPLTVHALCTEEDLRLTNITLNTNDYIEGRLQICLNNSWTGICYSFPNNFAQQNYSIVWNNIDARVACKQMGYLTTGNLSLINIIIIKTSTGSSHSSVIHTSTTIYNVVCFGYESKLVECATQFRDSQQLCNFDASVQCRKTGTNKMIP